MAVPAQPGWQRGELGSDIRPRYLGGGGITVAESPGKHRTLAEHWDGSKWTIVPTPNAFKDRIRNSGLAAVSGSSSSNVWAVGQYQPPGARGERGFMAIAALSRSRALAVGSYGAGTARLLTERWDGVRWTTVPNTLRPGVTFAYLTALMPALSSPSP
jgi:hypothetical protein